MPCNGGPWGRGGDGDDCEEVERAACRARWAVLQFVEGRMVPPKILREIRAEQLKHRRADLKDVLRKIRDRRREIAEDVKEIRRLGGTPAPKLAREDNRWRAEEARLKNLSDDVLLRDYWATERRFHQLG